MNNEYEQYYCKSCGSLFNDLVHKPYYKLNNFVDNQNCLIDGVQYKHDIVQPKYRSNCPNCYSKHTTRVNDIITAMQSVKGTNNIAGFNQYNRGKAKLYKKIIDKLEATKHLNKTTNNYKCKVKK